MKHIISFCLIILNNFTTEASACVEISTLQTSVEEAYTRSDMIALVTKIDSRDDTILRLQVWNYFKGSSGDTIDVIFPINFPVILSDEVWLVYLVYDEKKRIYFQECYPNRMMPKYNLLSSVPGPEEKRIPSDYILLSNELDQLRLRKIEKMIDDLNQARSENKSLIPPIFYLSLILTFLNLVIFYLLWVRSSSR